MPSLPEITELRKRIAALEAENEQLRLRPLSQQGHAVSVPETLKPLFDAAEKTVGNYFQDLKMDPTMAKIEIQGQRYLLVRASALSTDFIETVQKLYADRGEPEALAIGKNLLFDLAHAIGMNDAKNFHQRMDLKDPIAKLSAGPVHFAYTGWAFVDILPESHPTPDEDFLLIYNHPYSFEAESWKLSGKRSGTPMCIMNSGYSSGWCEESFGIELTAVEVSCMAMGDEQCTFIMSPPDRIQEHLEKFHRKKDNAYTKDRVYTIPTFFERKRVEEELQKSKQLAEASAKAKSDFVANMSHELRTPLNAILGFSDLMHKTPLLPEQREYMEAINSSGSSLLAIINDVLDLSKMDAAQLSPAREHFRVPKLLHTIEQMFAAPARARNLELTFMLEEGLEEPLIGDPQKLKQILVNLVGNALKFTKKGSIKINSKLINRSDTVVQVHFSVADTGMGIPKEKLDSIFERFNQGNNGIDRQFGGTGLGLSIAQQLVALLGGTLSVESQESVGSIFYFNLSFPISTAPEQHSRQESYRQSWSGSHRTILLVEDSLMNQKLATLILKQYHFEVEVTNNGQEAVDILKQRQFDLILMDIQMPVMDGCAAARIIRNDLKITTPIIAVTAYALDQERAQCIKEGMNDYLPKPFNETELLQKISLWLAPPESQFPSGQVLVDLSFLITQSGNNTGFIEEMAGLFIEENPKAVVELEAALAQHNLPAVRKIAHTMKSSVTFFGLDKHIGAALKQLENLRPEDQLNHLLPSIKTICAQAVNELRKLQLSPGNTIL